MKSYSTVMSYAEKILLWNSPQYKKIEKIHENYNSLNDSEKQRFDNTLNGLYVSVIDDDEVSFRNNFWY